MRQDKSRDTADSTDDAPIQLLTFSLDGGIYGVDILQVREIRGWTPVTPIPQSPPCMLGVLNLRGEILPVVDLRARLALPLAEFTDLTVVIVLTVETASGQRECGVVADNVQDVIDISAQNIRPAPAMHGGSAGEFIQGIVTLDQGMLILLKVDELVRRDLPVDPPAVTAA